MLYPDFSVKSLHKRSIISILISHPFCLGFSRVLSKKNFIRLHFILLCYGALIFYSLVLVGIDSNWNMFPNNIKFPFYRIYFKQNSSSNTSEFSFLRFYNLTSIIFGEIFTFLENLFENIFTKDWIYFILIPVCSIFCTNRIAGFCPRSIISGPIVRGQHYSWFGKASS